MKNSINFSNFSKISISKREKKPENQLKKNLYNYHYSKNNDTIRIYNDFSTPIENIQKKTDYRFSLYLDEKTDTLYLKRESDGITIKNTEKKSESDNYFQIPKRFSDNLKKQDLKIDLEKIDENTYKIDYSTIKK